MMEKSSLSVSACKCINGPERQKLQQSLVVGGCRGMGGLPPRCDSFKFFPPSLPDHRTGLVLVLFMEKAEDLVFKYLQDPA